MAAFTHYWKNTQFDRESYQEGQPLQHTAGNEFVENGVEEGDTIYVVTIKQGTLFLLARMTGIRFITPKEAQQIIGQKPWGGEQIYSDQSTPMRFKRIVPVAIANRLRFGDEKPLKFVEPGILDRQALRGVRRLTLESSGLLDILIDEPTEGPELDRDFPDELPAGSYPEGLRKQITVNAYERNPRARRACIAHYGTRCHVCTLDFVARYGNIGRDFIHVHHLKQLAKIGKEYEVNPVKDLRPVCPNCHAMLHRQKPPLSMHELKTMLRS